jgi:hypothetical protein
MTGQYYTQDDCLRLLKSYQEQRTLLGRYELCLTDIAAASNHKELCEAILKHGDVFREVWDCNDGKDKP